MGIATTTSTLNLHFELFRVNHQQITSTPINTANMSSESFAMTRKTMGPELARLAEEHMKHDLQQSDRDALRKAASTVSTHATVGSLLGLALGTLLAFRIRSNRTAIFKTFRTTEQPVALRFASGKEQPLPDLTAA